MGEPALKFNPFTETFDWVVLDGGLSKVGEFTVPAGLTVGDIVYPSGNLAADKADNSSSATVPAVAMVVKKPTATTATLLFMGRVDGLAGLTAGDELFLGTGGSIVNASGLPSAVGSYIQKIGDALSTTSMVFKPQLPVRL